MTLEQERAALAFQHVQTVKDEEQRKIYGSMAQKLPALIRSAGLCQALHFVKSRGKTPLITFLDHLGEQLRRADADISDAESLCRKARLSDLAHYVWLTREVLASVGWYARLSQSEWGILPGTEPGSKP
jgi:CRISPR type III-B/RAMP module-associated protein Cmr5